jgi:hypothetical protein
MFESVLRVLGLDSGAFEAGVSGRGWKCELWMFDMINMKDVIVRH